MCRPIAKHFISAMIQQCFLKVESQQQPLPGLDLSYKTMVGVSKGTRHKKKFKTLKVAPGRHVLMWADGAINLLKLINSKIKVRFRSCNTGVRLNVESQPGLEIVEKVKKRTSYGSLKANLKFQGLKIFAKRLKQKSVSRLQVELRLQSSIDYSGLDF